MLVGLVIVSLVVVISERGVTMFGLFGLCDFVTGYW